jgi:hypothetical protein
VADERLGEALAALDNSVGEPSRFHEPFLRMLPLTGAAVSTIGPLLGSETIAASDSVALRIDELQIDLGEGPCWDAMATSRPILEPDIRDNPRTNWPAFSAAVMDQPVGSLFAFPLIVGNLKIGAVDLYSSERAHLNPTQIHNATAMASAVSRHVLRRALHEIGGEYENSGTTYSRRIVHQATGMLIAQLRVPSDDAALILQGQAFATDRTMMDVAQAVVDRRITFVHGSEGIEVERG